MSKLEILPVIPEDEKAIVALFKREKAIWRWGLRTPWFRFWNFRGRTERWHKAVLNGEIVGSVHWSITLSNVRNLYDLAVARDRREQGIGRALVEFVGTPAKLKVDRGAPAQDFFRHLGFIEGPLEGSKTQSKFLTTFFKEHTPVDVPHPRIMTYTGRLVNPFALSPDQIVIEDIAHGLACCNRFVGQAIKPISVAQHSVSVSKLVEPLGVKAALYGLLHDASEAYLGDVATSVKHSPEMAEFRAAEARTQGMIFTKFNCHSCDVHLAVDDADRLMLRFEAPRAFGDRWQGFDNPVDDIPLTPDEIARIGKWAPLNWRMAEDAFLAQYRKLDRVLQQTLTAQ